MSPRLAFALEAATKAGRSTLAHFQSGVAVDRKSDASPVTIADRHAERLIREAIAREFPNDAILGEEEGGDATSPHRWVIDPIDGTKSFISGVPLYSTLLSYEVDQVPILGVVYFPALNELLYAEVGSGAFFNGRPCHVSSTGNLSNAVICCGGHSSMVKYGRMNQFLELAPKVLATRTWSDAYGHALVATGRVEAMIDPVVSRWDISALAVILSEAGGTFTTLTGGNPLSPVHDDGGYEAMSTNRHLVDALMSVFE
jgi:histidinol phosphatase-like enzyme (inositol monophosphatase family)